MIKKYEWKLIYYRALNPYGFDTEILSNILDGLKKLFLNDRKEIATNENMNDFAFHVVQHLIERFNSVGIDYHWKEERPDCVFARAGHQGAQWDEDGVLTMDYTNTFIINMN